MQLDARAVVVEGHVRLASPIHSKKASFPPPLCLFLGVCLHRLIHLVGVYRNAHDRLRQKVYLKIVISRMFQTQTTICRSKSSFKAVNETLRLLLPDPVVPGVGIGTEETHNGANAEASSPGSNVLGIGTGRVGVVARYLRGLVHHCLPEALQSNVAEKG